MFVQVIQSIFLWLLYTLPKSAKLSSESTYALSHNINTAVSLSYINYMLKVKGNVVTPKIILACTSIILADLKNKQLQFAPLFIDVSIILFVGYGGGLGLLGTTATIF